MRSAILGFVAGAAFLQTRPALPDAWQTGACLLAALALLLAFNQVVIKISGDGFAPVFQAGLRSAGAAMVVPPVTPRRPSARSPRCRGMRTSTTAFPRSQRCWWLSRDSPADSKPSFTSIAVKSRSIVGWARMSRAMSASLVGLTSGASRSMA